MPQKVCRTCLKLFDNESQLINIESKQRSNKNLKQKLQVCVPDIVLSRVLNCFICYTCVSELNVAYSFKAKCTETERKLSEYMTKKTVNTIDLVSFVQDTTNGNVSEDDVTIISDSAETPSIPNRLPPNNNIKCTVCQKPFDTAAQVKEHLNSHMEQQFKCNVCSFRTKKTHIMKRHLRKHASDDKTFRCTSCNFVTNDRKAEIDHYNKKHKNVTYHFCNTCSYKTNRTFNFRQHLKKHPEKFKCKDCSFTTAGNETLQKHIDSNHKEAVTKKSNNVIANKNPFYISVAEIKSILKGKCLKEVTDESKTDDLNPFTFTVDEIKKMIQSNGKTVKKQTKEMFPCPNCQLSFKFQHLLNKHIANRHSDNKTSQQCNKCDFTTTQKTVFNLHKKTHLGDKIYSCGKCKFRTAYLSNMLKHNNIHTGQKMLRCSMCKYGTFIDDNMNKHIQSHSKSKIQLKCPDCPFETVSPDEMVQHTEMHVISNEFIDNSIHNFLPYNVLL